MMPTGGIIFVAIIVLLFMILFAVNTTYSYYLSPNATCTLPGFSIAVPAFNGATILLLLIVGLMHIFLDRPDKKYDTVLLYSTLLLFVLLIGLCFTNTAFFYSVANSPAACLYSAAAGSTPAPFYMEQRTAYALFGINLFAAFLVAAFFIYTFHSRISVQKAYIQKVVIAPSAPATKPAVAAK